jgi:hypothetical protein
MKRKSYLLNKAILLIISLLTVCINSCKKDSNSNTSNSFDSINVKCTNGTLNFDTCYYNTYAKILTFSEQEHAIWANSIGFTPMTTIYNEFWDKYSETESEHDVFELVNQYSDYVRIENGKIRENYTYDIQTIANMAGEYYVNGALHIHTPDKYIVIIDPSEEKKNLAYTLNDTDEGKGIIVFPKEIVKEKTSLAANPKFEYFKSGKHGYYLNYNVSLRPYTNTSLGTVTYEYRYLIYASTHRTRDRGILGEYITQSDYILLHFWIVAEVTINTRGDLRDSHRSGRQVTRNQVYNRFSSDDMYMGAKVFSSVPRNYPYYAPVKEITLIGRFDEYPPRMEISYCHNSSCVVR